MREMFPRPLFAPDGAAGAGAAGGSDGGAGAGAGASTAGAAGGGGAAPAWYDATEGLTAGLNPDQRTFLAGKKSPDLQTFVSSAMEADRLARDRNVLPRPDPEKLGEWAGWETLGWKPNRDEYQLKKPQVPEGILYDEAYAKTVTDLAHEARVPVAGAQKMLDGLFAYMADTITNNDATGARENRDLDAALKTEWGGDYDRNKELASRAMRFFGIGLDDGAELESVIGSARQMKLFHKIGDMLGEDRLVSSGGTGGFGGMSLSQIDAELNRLAGDPEFMKAFGDPRHPRHEDVKAQRQGLLAKKAKLAP